MYQAKAHPSGYRRLAGRLGLALGFVAILCLVLLAVLAAIVWRGGYAIGIDTAPSRQLLTILERQAGLSRTATGPIGWTPVDGTTPDMASRSYTAPAAAPLHAAVISACGSQKLLAPGPNDRRMVPDMVCQGSWKGKDVTVELHDRCAGSCRIILSVNAI